MNASPEDMLKDIYYVLRHSSIDSGDHKAVVDISKVSWLSYVSLHYVTSVIVEYNECKNPTILSSSSLIQYDTWL